MDTPRPKTELEKLLAKRGGISRDLKLGRVPPEKVERAKIHLREVEGQIRALRAAPTSS